MRLIIDDQEEQLPDNTLSQIPQPEKINIVIEPPPLLIVPSPIKQTTNTRNKFSKTTNIEHTVLKDATNSEISAAATKGSKRKIPSSPKSGKRSARLATKRNQ
jgi:hypothetical protein